MEHIELVTINKLWGNSSYDYAFSSSLGNSGGILCVLEPTLFLKENITSSDYFLAVTGTWIPTEDGECVIMGDFNEVRSENERCGSVFNVQSDAAFNNFISLASLIDLPLNGYAYTWVHKSTIKMSKLDRFLISKGLMASFPHLSAICLDKHLSDHCPILMREMNIDYGPTPFRFFHLWFQIEGGSNKVILNDRSILLKELHDIISLDLEEMTQKAKLRCAIEGDENSKPVSHRICLADVFNNQLSLEQQDDLERTVSVEEIKRAMWDCGTNKSPGLDGFTFEFFRRYWKFLENDISVVVMEFFSSDTFSKGCNSSVIALIPKTQNAKTVKDFRPISLIGSLYKIIAKILANRLSFVIPDLISDVQSAFISNWQILDGPFILNDLLSWCKYKKLKAMVFKVEFEKAFDSIRWDYLDDVLKSFGFGDKWRGWISGCLKSAKESVLVNGSPTPKFQFRRGLKQGDHLSTFLFILIMESLHLSFKKVMNAGLFTGISLDNSLTISHLFYADDAIFVGKWDSSNLKIILKVLKCFHMASGLKININKSKLMGYGVHSDEVETTARYIGCATFAALFSHLGVKVGGRMERIKSWDDVISKVTYRLSKWKLTTLSIGAIHGEKGNLRVYGKITRHSHWLDIVREINVLRTKGIDFLSLIREKLAMSFEASGDISVTLARRFIDDYLLPEGDVQTRWVKVVPIKINIFAWRVRLDKLPTRLNLSLRGIEISFIMCPLCNSSVESASHLFFTCHVARLIWKKVLQWWDLDENMIDSYDDWLLLLKTFDCQSG
nr:RNA-directed DNA polymerase, eukaryota, reverse transcriptase zinc-binding domain protein [Tanacetum cinerariifolium]